MKSLATLSTGEFVANPEPLTKSLKKLRRSSRQLSRKRKGSNNRHKAAVRVARLHARVKNVRADVLHKLTAKLCRENQAVAIEDLNVSGMVRNRSLARVISDTGMREFRRQMEYKAELHGTRLVMVGRFFPSSKTCSRCGEVRENLSLSERVFVCGSCGFTTDRDLNAALNLRTAGLAGTDACGPDGSGGEFVPHQPAGLKQELDRAV